jgi:hypothetical protein
LFFVTVVYCLLPFFGVASETFGPRVPARESGPLGIDIK